MKTRLLLAAVASVILLGNTAADLAADDVAQDLKRIGVSRGIVALIGTPRSADYPLQLAKAGKMTVYCQCGTAAEAERLRALAAEADLLADRIFVAHGSPDQLQLADNIADAILVLPSATKLSTDRELLRVLRPLATAHIGNRKLTKPVPSGVDDWSHPYHGPDNNPQSEDQLVRGSFRTQFLGYPMFSPMPEQSVIAGGRIYKAMGHIAHKANQNKMLNTLMCINAYNGTILWSRPLPKGFMIHRNTMIATSDGLWMGDHESCKFIDGQTGETRDQIRIPEEISDGPVWKWMALSKGVLYGLVGNLEMQVDTQRSTRPGLGHWPWGMWKGHDYKDPRTAFGFGRTLVAIDLKSKKILWHHRDEQFLDARGVCMNDDRIFCFSPPAAQVKHKGFLLCVDRATGKPAWRSVDPPLFEAIGPNTRAQHYITGYSTACYIKCNQDSIFFAGPQRKKMVVASVEDGRLRWTYPTGNLQLVLRDDGVWAAGPQRSKGGVRLDYASGRVLAEFPARRACTRATGCADSIFFRANGGTVRVLTESTTAQHIAPMRPPCQDGVLIAGGHLYWGPWMCGCQLSLYGNIGLAPQGEKKQPAALLPLVRETGTKIDQVVPLKAHADDWVAYRGNNQRNDVTAAVVPSSVQLAWTTTISKRAFPTAPLAAGSMAFVGDRSGAVTALNQDGSLVWRRYTGGPIYYPPAIAHDRLFVGSADGRVYAYEAKTGRFLWSVRVAPADRVIPVYGKLISTWPVAGGVVVKGDTVYAAAGIAHYDGTHVVALDTHTGEVKARNHDSGSLAKQVNSGISLQGALSIAGNELQFLAGGVYEVARYDLKTLECLNTPKSQVRSQFRTAFYPYYPTYARFVSLEHTLNDGRILRHDASYEGSRFANLAFYEPLPPGTQQPRTEAARWILRRAGKQPKMIWQDKANRRFTSFVLSGDTLLSAGHTATAPGEFFLAATKVEDGTDLWLQKLPELPVKGGIAIDHQKRIYVSLESGKLLCYAKLPRQTPDR